MQGPSGNKGQFSRQLGFVETLISWRCIQDEALFSLTTYRITVTIFNYVPLSEARKVALYILFFTFGDSLSKTAIVVICPFTGSIFSQLAGSDNFVYLQNESAVSLIFLWYETWNRKRYFIGFVPNATSSLICTFVDDGWKESFCMEKYFCKKYFCKVVIRST